MGLPPLPFIRRFFLPAARPNGKERICGQLAPTLNASLINQITVFVRTQVIVGS
jgi:hypothetical protein